MNICPFCNAPLEQEGKFCPHCGKERLSGQEKKSRFGIYVTLALLLAALFLFFFSGFEGTSAESVVKDQLKAIQENKLTEAYYAYTSKEFQAATSLDEFKKFIKGFPLFTEKDESDLETLAPQGKLKVVKGVLKKNHLRPLTVHYQLIDEDGSLKILNLKVIPATNEEDDLLRKQYKEVLVPLEAIIGKIKSGSIDEVYNTFSPGFREVTTLPQFKLFLDHFQILTQFESYDLLDVVKNGDAAIVKLEMRSKKLLGVVDYTLVKEGEEWRLRGIQVISQQHTPDAVPDFNEELLVTPIREHLKQIKEGNLNDAYEKGTSKAFKESTSKAQYLEFMKSFPIFKNHTAEDFYNLTFNNNVGIYNLRLKGPDGKDEEVEFSLIKEDGIWKILQIQIYEEGNAP